MIARWLAFSTDVLSYAIWAKKMKAPGQLRTRECVGALEAIPLGRSIEEVMAEYGIADVIKMASNENPLGPSPLAMEAVREALSKGNYYPDAAHTEAKKALAAHHAVRQENLVIGNGAGELIPLIARTFLNPGEELIIPALSYGPYRPATILMEANVIFSAMKGYAADLEDIPNQVTPKTKIIALPNPNNPTGTIFTEKEFGKLLEKIPESTLVILDEAYHDFVESPDYPEGIKHATSGANVIVLRTLSKIYGLAGFRLGYGISRPEIIGSIEKVREPYNVNLLAQVAAVAALKDREHAEKTRRTIWEGKRYIYGEMKKLGLEYVPTEANFIVIKTEIHADDIHRKLMEKGVIIRPGTVFGREDFIRVTIGADHQNRMFVKALKEVLEER